MSPESKLELPNEGKGQGGPPSRIKQESCRAVISSIRPVYCCLMLYLIFADLSIRIP